MMRSLLVTRDYWPPQTGGIANMMQAVSEHTGSVKVLTASPGAEEPNVWRNPAFFAESKLRNLYGWAVTYPKLIGTTAPQLLQLATIREGYIGLRLRKLLDTPYVVYAHGNDIVPFTQSDREIWPVARRALLEADAIIAVSHFTASLLENAGVHPDKIRVIHPGCNLNDFGPMPAGAALRHRLLGSHTGPVILTVGNLVERKGHDQVIKALPSLLLKIPDARYLIVGDGPYRPQLEQLSAELQLSQHVHFAGRLKDVPLAEIYALCDLFIMPSRQRLAAADVEGFGLVFLEANACGKPVIAGRSGGIVDAVEDGRSGFLVDPMEPLEISNKMSKLLCDSELASRMGARGLERVRNQFTWERFGDETLSLFRELIA